MYGSNGKIGSSGPCRCTIYKKIDTGLSYNVKTIKL